MKIKTFTFNDLGVNSYLLISELNNCILIDPSCYYPEEKEEAVNKIHWPDRHDKYLSIGI